MTIREAIYKIENYELAWLDIENFIARTEYNPAKLKQLKSEIGLRIIEKKRDVGSDPVKLFESIHEDIKKSYKDKNEEELKKIFIEKHNESKRRSNRNKLHVDLFDQLRNNWDESEIEYDEKNNYLTLISICQLDDKHGEVIAYTFIQIYHLIVVEAAIEGLLKIVNEEPEAIEALKKYLEKHHNISIDENEANTQIDLSPSLEELVEILEREPNRKMKKEEISYVVYFADQKKNVDNISELARQIQKSDDCPSGLKDEGDSKKQTKRIKTVIKRYDKYSCNTRNYNRPSHSG